jgi:hypothetical protein
MIEKPPYLENTLISLPQRVTSRNGEDVAASAILVVLVSYVLLRSLVAAVTTPLWFDEICTWIVSRQPTVGDIWRVLSRGADGQPPLFYWLTRASLASLKYESVAIRLPEILAFGCLLACLFIYAKKRTSGPAALFCAALPLLTMLYDPFGVEARPYTILMAFIAFACVCYQRAPEKRWMILMALSLAAAECFHYYSIFALFAFALAEISFWLQTKRFRLSVWVALFCTLPPIAICWPLLSIVRNIYGKHYWAMPSIRTALSFYAWTFHFVIRSFTLDAALSIGLVAACISLLFPKIRKERFSDPHLNEHVLVVGFLALPFAALVALKLTHGGMDNRYILPSALAFPLGACYLVPRSNRAIAAALCGLLLTGIVIQEIGFWKSPRGHLNTESSPAVPIVDLVGQAGHPELPVVVSEGFVYLQLAYYAPKPALGRFVSVADPDEAVKYTGTDAIDKNLLILASCYPLHVEMFSSFSAKHRQFLLYSGGGSWDWWHDRLVHDGHMVTTAASDGDRRVYLVDLDKRDNS